MGTDTVSITEWARSHVPGFTETVDMSKIPGGQSNPTYRLETRNGLYVLRSKPPGALLKSAHAVDREFRVQKALANTDVPVAGVHGLCEDATVFGTDFYIMDHVDGRIFDRPSLPELAVSERAAFIDEMNRVLAKIHKVDIESAGLGNFGPPGHYCKRQTDRWTKQYRASQTDELPDMDELISWLDSNMPADDGLRGLVHGDYRMDNLIFASDRPEIIAVLDWELSTTGHPFADLASVIMQWSMPATSDGRGLAGVNRAKTGLWSDQRFIDTYCMRMDLPGIGNFNFYLAFCFFRMAAILQGVKKRALDGNASDPKRALQLGAHVPDFARAGLEAAGG
ncbi:MAG: phosphotransferase family protein [Roseovarius sp.]|nr:phosphotransferase family protein [Roseovarius sp.]